MTNDLAEGTPSISATARNDGTGVVTINGTPTAVRGATLRATRAAVLEVIRDYARSLSRPVRATTHDPNGDWTIVVFPDGRIEDADAAATAQPQDGGTQQPAPLTVAREAHQPAPARMTTSTMTPTFADVSQRLAHNAAPTPAMQGWRGAVTKASGRHVRMKPSAKELREREAIHTVSRSLSGPRTIVVVNPKGGSQKTTSTLLLAVTLGGIRGGSTLAWDNNETNGTLGWRAPDAAQQRPHTNTAVELLRDLDRFNDPVRARVGDLDNYVRSQGAARFDVLASSDDPEDGYDDDTAISGEDFRRLHATLARFYRILVVDTGNNMRAGNWRAAVELADQLVITLTVRADSFQSAAWMVDGLRKRGQEAKVANAVTIMGDPNPKGGGDGIAKEIEAHFQPLTRAVHRVPYDASLSDGAAINLDLISHRTREAWLCASAAVARGL